MLDLSVEGLRKLMAKDSTFPKPYKLGVTRQSPVYFDYAELVQWHNSKKQDKSFKSAGVAL
jgi:predicted DNA-binding transcriptional regulator AlpA